MTSPMCERSFESPSYGTSESESQISSYKQDTEFEILWFVNKSRVSFFICVVSVYVSIKYCFLFLIKLLFMNCS